METEKKTNGRAEEKADMGYPSLSGHGRDGGSGSAGLHYHIFPAVQIRRTGRRSTGAGEDSAGYSDRCSSGLCTESGNDVF